MLPHNMRLEGTMDKPFLIEGNLGRNNNVWCIESNNARNNRGWGIKNSLNLDNRETDKDTKTIALLYIYIYIYKIFLKVLLSDPLCTT